jgi:phosphoribosylformylglycinamidine synthase
MHVWLDRVPLRDASLSPEEILMSESQERMCAIVTPEHIDAFMVICAKWDVEAVVIGEVTDSGKLVVQWHGEEIVNVPPRSVAHDGPVYERPYHRPSWQDALQANEPTASVIPRPESGEQLKETLLQLIGSPNLASKTWVTSQYDRYVLGNTVLAQPEDTGMIRIDEETRLGVAIATDCNARFTKLDPYNGAKLALAESYRNVSVSGAIPLAVTNCLNFGSPEDPEVMWQFAEATRGLADGCLELGVPVTGGNVSFYNQTGETAILPTPVVGVLGVIDDVERRTPMAWSKDSDGELIYVLGDTSDEFGGSEWAHIHGHLGGMPPKVDLQREKLLSEILVAASRDGMITAAHDISDGGFAIAIAEMAMRAGTGARLWVPDNIEPFIFLYAESTGRAVVVIPRSEELRFTEMCAARGLPAERVGVVDSGLGVDSGFPGEQVIVMGDYFTLTLEQLRETHEATLPAIFNS